jgi:hypothetical protein
MVHEYKYYISGHYLLSSFNLKNDISETGFCLRLQVKHKELGPIDRASSYLRVPVPTQDRIHHKPSRTKTICEH